jgi:hypothetical protein
MFWKLFSQSVVITGGLALILVGTYCGCVLLGRTAPQELVNLTYIVVAFFFGSKLPAIKEITTQTK